MILTIMIKFTLKDIEKQKNLLKMKNTINEKDSTNSARKIKVTAGIKKYLWLGLCLINKSRLNLDKKFARFARNGKLE